MDSFFKKRKGREGRREGKIGRKEGRKEGGKVKKHTICPFLHAKAI